MLVVEVTDFRQKALFVAEEWSVFAREEVPPPSNYTYARRDRAELTRWDSREHAISPVANAFSVTKTYFDVGCRVYVGFWEKALRARIETEVVEE